MCALEPTTAGMGRTVGRRTRRTDAAAPVPEAEVPAVCRMGGREGAPTRRPVVDSTNPGPILAGSLLGLIPRHSIERATAVPFEEARCVVIASPSSLPRTPETSLR